MEKEKKTIRTAAVIGAGAVGSFFLTGLSSLLKENLWTIASGERKEKLEKDGIIVNNERISLNVRTPKEAKGADLVIVCVKYGALCEAVEMLQEIADPHTVILCPMNGVDTEEIIARTIPAEQILLSMMVIAAERSENRIIYNEGVRACVHYGIADGFGTSENLEAVSRLFERAEVCAKQDKDIIEAIWNKFALNISTNIAQAIIGCSYGAYKTSPYMNQLGQKLCDEVLMIAKAKGISCTFDNQRALKTIKTSNAARFSTLQDLSAGRHTEADMFCGALMRMGKELHVPTPFNEFAYLAIKALEEKNDGLIS